MGIAADQFRIAEIDVDGRVGLAVTGEIDEGTCSQLDAAFGQVANGGGATVVLDLDECTFIDSSGLDVILRAATRLLDEGRQLVVQNARGPIRELFRTTGATDWPGLILHRGP